ncbi:MAG TPA: hypothetical protein VLA72_06655 [Anaerolineales bacterium]|nr:hypothetical protein [Anaerolineales bacterium]
MTNTLINEQRRIVAYLDGLPPSLRFGDLRQAKVNALREGAVHGWKRVVKRPDRFPRHFAQLESLSTHWLRVTRVMIKPVRSEFVSVA